VDVYRSCWDERKKPPEEKDHQEIKKNRQKEKQRGKKET